jgi:ArsR family transcriptional regulator
MQDADLYKALASDKRLAVLEWLKDPRAHFPPQVDGDLVEDGVCALYIAEKLGVGQATLSEHMRVLVRAELLTAKKIKQWTFYRRNEARIETLKAELFAHI